MKNEYDFLKKQRYEYYKGSSLIIDNESNELVEDVVDVLNQKDYNIIELLKIKQIQAQRIAELEEQLKNAIVPKFKVGQELYLIDDYYSIIPFEIDKILITDNGVKIKSVEWNEWFEEDECFVTREDAQEILDRLSSTNGQNE